MIFVESTGANLRLDNCYFQGGNAGGFTGSEGAELYLGAGYARISNCAFASQAATYSVYAETTAPLNELTNNYFRNPVYFGSNTNIIVGNYIMGTLTINSYSTVIGNRLSSGLTVIGINNYVRSNTGFVTENSGTATISASTSVTFTHGLAGTPTHVDCGFKTAGYGSWTWSANSTHITITVANPGTYNFSWYAEYEP